MIQKKICLLGSFSVGKTSLIRQFVRSMFDEKYLTTIGVKVDKKELKVNHTDVMLMIWDLAGEDAYNSLNPTYLRGAAGYIVVIDGTRGASIQTALDIHEKAQGILGSVPCVAAINKADLADQWAISESQIADLETRFPLYRTSAKTGQNVEALFEQLTTNML